MNDYERSKERIKVFTSVVHLEIDDLFNDRTYEEIIEQFDFIKTHKLSSGVELVTQYSQEDFIDVGYYQLETDEAFASRLERVRILEAKEAAIQVERQKKNKEWEATYAAQQAVQQQAEKEAELELYKRLKEKYERLT